MHDTYPNSETVLAGHSAEEVTLGGLDSNYELLVDYGSTYSLFFTGLENRSQLTPDLKHVLSSFRFTK
jgi:hypothetical protein